MFFFLFIKKDQFDCFSGEISLRSCKAYDCSQELVYLTASNETFNFRIKYEKPIDTKCQYDEDCQSSYSIKDLIRCEKSSQTCQCYDENITHIDVPGVGRLCTDSIDQSQCTKFSRRCLQWCDGSETSYCVCPKSTRKVRKIDGLYDCELEPTGNCRFDDDEQLIGSNIRKCPTGRAIFNCRMKNITVVIGTFCDGQQCRPPPISRQLYEEIPFQSRLSATARIIQKVFTSTRRQVHRRNESLAFVRILVAVTIAIILFFILITLIIIILIKSQRFRVSSTTSEDKVSSSSFAQSTSTALSTDSPTNINYLQEKQQPSIATLPLINYQNYLNKSTFAQGLVPQTNLSPRFHRQQQTLDEKRRVPLHIRSPSLLRINPFIDHASLTTKENLLKKRPLLPQVTRLQNGDVIISA